MAAKKRKQKKAASKSAKPRAKEKSLRAALPLRDKRGRFIARPKRRDASRVPSPAELHKPLETAGERPRRPLSETRPAPLPVAPPYVRQTFKAKVGQAFSAPQYDVTTGEERAITTHIALREKAAKEQRFVVPSQALRHVADPHRQALKKSATVGLFLSDRNLETILYKAGQALKIMSTHAKGKTRPRYVLELNNSEYGIELYGSDKGEIARVDGLRSEALHWTKTGTRASDSTAGALAILEEKLGGFLKRRGRTTMVVETITVTMLFDK